MSFVDEYPDEAKLVRYSLLVSFVALGIGGLFGLVQALYRTGRFRNILPSASDYYTLLTGHGVLLALVFTTFFLVGIFTWGVTKSLDRNLVDMRLSWAWFTMMLVGTVMAAFAVIGGIVKEIPMQADVLFTFYAPLKAHPVFYVGLAIFLIGTWIAGFDWFRSYWAWRKENKGERIPLQTFMTLTTVLMWYICTAGLAIEVVFLIIPWSLGLISEVDPLLTRTLFWYFGHAVVYFWLLPAYFVWYTIMPKLAGGRLFSDSLARVVFILFLLLSTPTGFHHQYVDPGIAEGFKFLAMINTMFLLLPSLMTAFTVVASIEHGARQRGGKGYFGWIRKLPWSKPAFSGCALAGLMFAAGGFSGMINAGMNINYLVHNTIWIPGHFHLTVGTAVALTFMAITYWLLPQITGNSLRLKTLGAIQPYLWFLGMTLMSNAMHREGLTSVPRRTAQPEYNIAQGVEFQAVFGSITEIKWQIAIGGTLLFVSLVLFLTVVTATWLNKDTKSKIDETIPPALSGPEHGPAVLDNLKLWGAIAVVLVLIAYGIPLIDLISDGILAPGSGPV